jgi:hypothetical protein
MPVRRRAITQERGPARLALRPGKRGDGRLPGGGDLLGLGGFALVVGFRLRIPLVRGLRERLLGGP